MKKSLSIIILATTGILLYNSCKKLTPRAPEDMNIIDGPIEDLTKSEMKRFAAGDKAFDEFFTIDMGLGPLYIANSCQSCHLGDGKGHPFSSITRFGQADTFGNTYLDQGAPQIQNRAIPGYEPKKLPTGAPYSIMTPPIVTGLGYLQYVSDADILALSEATNNFGIKGRPNWIDVPEYVKETFSFSEFERIQRGDGKYIGRFGLKASIFNLLQQTVTAYNEDMGITSTFRPIDSGTGKYMDPEVSNQKIHDIVFYLETLKAPTPRNTDKVEYKIGKSIFIEIGCESCHKQELKTGEAPIEALAYKTFHPYTDLLLHDLGEELDDGYTEGTALSSEWRTAPLWGLGLAPNSQGGRYFLMHDGRAKSIEEAIELHGGSASQVRDNYKSLNQEEKENLLYFLKSL